MCTRADGNSYSCMVFSDDESLDPSVWTLAFSGNQLGIGFDTNRQSPSRGAAEGGADSRYRTDTGLIKEASFDEKTRGASEAAIKLSDGRHQ